MADPIILSVPSFQNVVIDLGPTQILVRHYHEGRFAIDLENMSTGEVTNLCEPVPTGEPHLHEPMYVPEGLGPPPLADENTDARREVAKANPHLVYSAPVMRLDSGLEIPMREIPSGEPLIYQPQTSLPSLDSLLARAVVGGPTPAEEIIRSSSSPPAAPPPPLAPAAAVLSTPSLDGHDAAPAGRLAAAPGKPLDEAPRDGTFVMLNNGAEELAGRWSSAMGRQFWVDESGDSLGFDSEFSGWREPTEGEREEYGI